MICILFNFSYWKQKKIIYFLEKSFDKIIFFNNLDFLNQLVDSNNYCACIWGNRKNLILENYLEKNNILLYRVEDGFIRSLSLGSDFSQPYSLVLDKRGIYFDATKESDLEYILENYIFTKELLIRAKRIQKYLVKNQISKYNLFDNLKIKLETLESFQPIILVVGQVDGDASLLYGADNMKNIELLQHVREDNPEAYLLYKPHPDVLLGTRDGGISEKLIFEYANQIEERVDIDSLFNVVTEVATMTSLVGMEALIRGKKVTCYGLPFYSGWGLTVDKKKSIRRKRILSLYELIVGVYILYPKYINPKTLEYSEIETVLEYLATEKINYHKSFFYKKRIKLKQFFNKKYYALFRHMGRGESC